MLRDVCLFLSLANRLVHLTIPASSSPPVHFSLVGRGFQPRRKPRPTNWASAPEDVALMTSIGKAGINLMHVAAAICPAYFRE